MHLYFGSHVGGRKNAHQPVFPYHIIGNSPTSFAHNFVSSGPNYFKFGTETCFVVLQAIQKFLEKLIMICVIIFLMMSYENPQ